VIADAMEALESDYPDGRMIIMPVNDRSTDGTRKSSTRLPHVVRISSGLSTAPRASRARQLR
jgi:hypothetical protein